MLEQEIEFIPKSELIIGGNYLISQTNWEGRILGWIPVQYLGEVTDPSEHGWIFPNLSPDFFKGYLRYRYLAPVAEEVTGRDPHIIEVGQEDGVPPAFDGWRRLPEDYSIPSEPIIVQFA